MMDEGRKENKEGGDEGPIENKSNFGNDISKFNLLSTKILMHEPSDVTIQYVR